MLNLHHLSANKGGEQCAFYYSELIETNLYGSEEGNSNLKENRYESFHHRF